MSEKPVAQKLMIKEDRKVLFVNEPKGYRDSIGVPKNVDVLKGLQNAAIIQVFVNSRRDLEEQLPKLKKYLNQNGMLWVTYRKGSSKIKSDINRDSIYEYALSVGLQGVAMIAVDENWSALRMKLKGLPEEYKTAV